MPWTSNDIVTNSLKWKCDILYGQCFANHGASYFELRYEDLVSNPRRHTKTICEFIGEQYHDKMMEFYRTSKSYITNEPWKKGTCRRINTNATNKWKQELSETQVFIVEKITGSLMTRFGYEKTITPLTAKLMSPFIFLRDIVNYISYKSTNNQYRTKGIVSEKRRLYQMLVKSFFMSIPY